MGLLVWLPLNGNLNNQGVSSLVAVSAPASATVANDGKIGKCYTNSGDNAGTSNDFNFSASQFSIAAWVRINTRVNSWRCAFKLANSAGDKDYIGFCCEHNTTTTLVGFHFYKTISGTNTAIFDHYPTSINAAVGTWTHLALTYDGKEVKYYQDGVCKQTNAIAAAKQNTIANTNKLIMFGSDGSRSTAAVKHSLNDVRIYDHCLSAAEVHEISQGLVLHYKLDSLPYNFSTNTITSFTNFTIGQYYYTIFSINMTDFLSSTGAVNGDKFTFSVDINAASNTKNLAARVQHFNSSSDRNSVIGNDITPGSSGRSSITFTLNTAYTRLDFMINNGNSSNVTANSTEQYKCTRIEKGDMHTGYLSTTITPYIQDSSGYGHNGTITGNITLNSSTPRYSASSLFNGTERITTTTPGADIRTLSCWCKTTKNKSTSQQMVADSFSNMTISFYNGTIIGVFGTTRGTGSKCTLGDSYKENDWNHIVVVKTDDAGARDIYCNGVKLTPASNDYWSAATGFFVGARNISNNNPFYGQISDVRAYCTALSAADVKSLYEVGARVGNKGDLHCYELKEAGTLPKFSKRGIIQHITLRETALLNNIQSMSYKPAANTQNSCLTGAIMDFSQFADEGKPVTCTLNCDISWSSLTAGTGGTFRVLLQGSNRKKADNAFAWAGTNYTTNGYNFTSLVTANATGSTHRTYTFTIPATWFDTYNASYFGIRTDYANGTGTITISNLKLTVTPNTFKIKSNSIQADNLIEF